MRRKQNGIWEKIRFPQNVIDDGVLLHGNVISRRAGPDVRLWMLQCPVTVPLSAPGGGG